MADLINSTNLSGGDASDTGRVIAEIQQATNPDDPTAAYLWSLAPFGHSDVRQWLYDSDTVSAMGAPYTASPSAGESGVLIWPTTKVADDTVGEYHSVPVTTADAKVTWNLSKAAITAVRALVES